MIIKNVKSLAFSLFVLMGIFLSNTAQADSIVAKAYRAEFTDAYPKCIDCHSIASPQKGEGQHGWNTYGRRIKREMVDAGLPDVPTKKNISKIVDILSGIGRIEDFKRH